MIMEVFNVSTHLRQIRIAVLSESGRQSINSNQLDRHGELLLFPLLNTPEMIKITQWEIINGVNRRTP